MGSTSTGAPFSSLAIEARKRFVAAVEHTMDLLGLALREWLVTHASPAGSLRQLSELGEDLLAFGAPESRWVELVRGQLHKTLDAAAEPAASSGSALEPLRLELVGDEETENSLLSLRLALAIQNETSLEFNELCLRIQHLEGVPKLPAKDVLRPEVLARALVDQWVAAGLSRTLWAKAQELMHQRLLDALMAAYRDINVFLVSQGVMPEIDLKNLVRQRRGAPSPASTGVATGRPDKLAQQDSGAPPGSRFALASQRARSVISSLHRLLSTHIGGNTVSQHLDSGAEDERQASRIAPSFAAAIADIEATYRIAISQYAAGDPAGATRRVILDMRRHASELKRRAPTVVDKATIEIVALMFQSILAEERIPFSVRVWFARLQMPVLRVALADPEFFGTLEHPARMLIDRMGSCVLGFDAPDISGSALEGEIRRVVQMIEQYPETGQRVFRLAHDEFVAFLSKYLTQGDAAQRVMSVVQQVEQKKTMTVQYIIELRKMLDGIPVPESIRGFLFNIWAEAMAVAALRHGVQDEKTAALKRAASDLVWAASAKPQLEERKRVLQALPSLLQRLRQGMVLLGLTSESQDEHIHAIGQTLIDAFMSKTGTVAAAQIDVIAERLANLEAFFDDGQAQAPSLDVASIKLLLGPDAASIEVMADAGLSVTPEMRAWVNELQIGSWFLLDHSDCVSLVQFVWCSKQRQLHLFTSAEGRGFLIQAGRLASYLWTELLVPVEEETLTVRATRDALSTLDANPGQLLN